MTRMHLDLRDIPTCPDCGGHWLDDAPTSHIAAYTCWRGDESVKVCEKHLKERLVNGWVVKEVTANVHGGDCGISQNQSCSSACFELSSQINSFPVKYPPLARVFIPRFKRSTLVCELDDYNIYCARYKVTSERDDHLQS